MRIAILGGGFMGTAFLRGLLSAAVTGPDQITVAEIDSERRAALAEYGVRLTDDLASACLGAEVVLLALKPQDLEATLTLKGQLPPELLVVSIAAGVPLADVQQALGHRAVARVMPNLPAALGEGAAAYLLDGAVSPGQREQLRRVLAAVALVAIEVQSDEAVDLATALHGSGPAYVFLMIESMVDAAVRLGMKRPDALALTLATVVGSARYASETGSHPAELRNQVTSPGGTTAAALQALEASGFRASFDRAIEAAYARARLLAERNDAPDRSTR